jgi:hypothetical protein
LKTGAIFLEVLEKVLLEKHAGKQTVYIGLIGFIDGTLVFKVGCSDDLRARIAQLKRDFPQGFVLVFAMNHPDNRALEKIFHQHQEMRAYRKDVELKNGTISKECYEECDEMTHKHAERLLRALAKALPRAQEDERERRAHELELKRIELAQTQARSDFNIFATFDVRERHKKTIDVLAGSGFKPEYEDRVEHISLEVLRSLPDAYFRVESLHAITMGVRALEKLYLEHRARKRENAAIAIQRALREWFARPAYASGRPGLHFKQACVRWGDITVCKIHVTTEYSRSRALRMARPAGP